jgi:hypothetical protein
MNSSEAKDIPRLVGICLGIMVAMFIVVYVGNVVLLHFYPAAESFVG